MSGTLVVVGAGGFGREVLDVVNSLNFAQREPLWKIVGVADDAPTPENLSRLEDRTIPYLGTIETTLTQLEPTHYAMGIGAPQTRHRLSQRFDDAGWHAATLIHPHATTGSNVRIGAGTVICAGARLTTNIQLGRHVHINLNATIGHDSTLGDFVSVNPSACISGDCTIEDEVLVGVAGVILNGLTVHRGAIVGGSACVVQNVPAGAIAKGVPARYSVVNPTPPNLN